MNVSWHPSSSFTYPLLSSLTPITFISQLHLFFTIHDISLELYLHRHYARPLASPLWYEDFILTIYYNVYFDQLQGDDSKQ